MKPNIDPDRSRDDAADLSMVDSSRLLQLGLASQGRPIDELIDGLSGEHRARWLEAMLDLAPLADTGHTFAELKRGEVGIDDLVAIKEKSKAYVGQKNDRDSRLAGIACYFLAIATAIVHHHVLITARSRSEIDEILVDLANAMPDPWSDLFHRAAMSDADPQS